MAKRRVLMAFLVGSVTIWEATAALGAAVAALAKARLGVFGKINGKTFRATNLGRNDDPCVNGIYKPASGNVTFVAGECKRKRRRQGTAFKKNYKLLVMGCTNFDETVNTLTPPYEVPCGFSLYQETKTGRFGIQTSARQWGAEFDFSDPALPTSNVRLRVESFDGSRVRGTIVGVFEVPVTPDATPPAAIDGALEFDFPFRVQ